MAKGISNRRRVRRALDAAQGNLHKIANGKALPRSLGLPDAPKPADLTKLPASLRKMMALKEAAAKEQGGSGKKAAPLEQKGKGSRKRGPQEEDEDDGPSTSGRQRSTPDDRQQQKRQGGKGEQQGEEGGAPARGKGNPFMAAATTGSNKTLKAKKKEYLLKKKEQKKGKGAKGEMVVEKEIELKMRDTVKFGEVAHAPLEMHLKRKHWAEDKERSASERCKDIFLKQLQQAEHGMAAAGAGGGRGDKGGAAAAARGKGGAAGGSHKAAGGKAGQQDKKRKQPDEETEALRQQVIDSYRMSKRGGMHNASVGNATLASLAQLTSKPAKPSTFTLG